MKRDRSQRGPKLPWYERASIDETLTIDRLYQIYNRKGPSVSWEIEASVFRAGFMAGLAYGRK